MAETELFPAGGTKQATLRDVARLAGVSHQTVSRYFKGEAGIRESTRARVAEAAAALRFRPSPAGRSLATKRSFRLGALAYGLTDVGPSKMLQGASDEARRAGYLLDIVNVTSFDDAAIAEAITMLDQADLAGVVAFAGAVPVRDAVRNTAFRVPLVVATEDEDDGTREIESANTLGSRLAVEHLIGLGHRRILVIAGPDEYIASRNRVASYRRVMREHGLEPLPILRSDWSAEGGYEAGLRIAAEPTGTAVFAANDQIALGLMHALTERGIIVSGHMSVVGFDGSADSRFYLPPLTTVRLNFEGHGRDAVRSMIDSIEGRPQSKPQDDVRPQLVVRRSSGPVDASRP
jgi:DNA-binding LacI/PurR family transcriptional regulator